MTSINPYINFQGNTEEAFEFYRSVFGGEFAMVMRFGDTENGKDMSEADRGKIMHIALPVDNGHVIMGTDALESMDQKLNFGNNFSISIGTDSKAEAERLFNGLSAGGNVTMPMQDTFWGAYFGMFTDKFGLQWMVNCDEPA